MIIKVIITFTNNDYNDNNHDNYNHSQCYSNIIIILSI